MILAVKFLMTLPMAVDIKHNNNKTFLFFVLLLN